MRTERGRAWACLLLAGLLPLVSAQAKADINLTLVQDLTKGLCTQDGCDVELGGRGPSDTPGASTNVPDSGEQDDNMCLCPESYQKFCVCVEYFSCINGEVDTTAAAEGIITLSTRIDEKLRSNCTNRTQVCCELKKSHSDKVQGPSETEPTQGAPQLPVQSQPQVGLVPQAPSTLTTLVKPNKCGQYAKQGVGLHANNVFRKMEATPGEFPWMVAILRKDARTKRLKKDPYWCGGALLGPNVVLTAAHCVRNSPVEELSIVAGAWNRTSRTDAFEQQEIAVQERVLHPLHDNGNQKNDIALLVLDSPVRPARHISYACLPSPNQVPQESGECLLSGWGLPDPQSTVFSDVLRKTSASIIPNDGECRKQIVSVPGVNKEYKIDDSHICAAGALNAVTACQGDGGSPLVCPVSDTDEAYYVRGLASWGPEACSSTPSLYTNVAMFRTWVDGELEKLKIGTDTYTYSVN